MRRASPEYELSRKRFDGLRVGTTRSALMRRVKREHTLPEMIVRRELHSRGFRYRLHVSDLPGSPDLVFPGRRLVVFVHGCFWHRHQGCRRTTTPKTRAQFWEQKFRANLERDERKRKLLEQQGWAVHVVWECEARSGTYLETLLQALE
jgi:DNA mismatch endonuclease, patch repair protein